MNLCTRAIAATVRRPSEIPSDAKIVSHALTEAEAVAVHELARRCAAEYGRLDRPEFLADVGVIVHELPRPVRAALRRGRIEPGTHGILLTGNIVDEVSLEPTPESWRLAQTPGSQVYAFGLMLYGALLGDAIGWAGQQDGRLITDVVPTLGMEQSLISSSSLSELGWHTEDAFSAARADFVGLFSLRNPLGIPTTIAHLRDGELDPATLAVLREPRFQIRPDDAHDPASARRDRLLAPLLSGHPDSPTLRVDRDYVHVRDGDAVAQEAFAALVRCLDASLYDLVLAPGDVCLLDNRTVAHGRRPFQARYDGNDRWLKRINVVEDLRRTGPWRLDPASRIIGNH